MAVPNGFNVVNLEEFQVTKDRFAARFETSRLTAFVKYAEHNAAINDSAVFIDGTAFRAHAIFDFGSRENPLHSRSIARLSLDPSPSYLALSQVVAISLNQKAIVNFLDEWKDNIVSVASVEGVDLSHNQAVTALKKLTIERANSITSLVDDFAESRSAFESIEAKSEMFMPSYFVFRTTPYAGLGSRDLVVKISILTGDSTIKIATRINQLASIKEEMADEFEKVLIDELGDMVRTYIGNI